VGIGCVTNGATAVCSFLSSSNKPADIQAYDIEGNILWSSTALLRNAYFSAPVIGPDGGVIMADGRNIFRFGPSGEIVWRQPTAGGNPISPNVTDNGKVILGTQSGPVSAYDFATGDLLAQLELTATFRIRGTLRSGFFDTINTPAIRGNRIYISTRFSIGSRATKIGRLYALDLIENNGTYNFEVAWFLGFRAPSGTSPTLSTDDQGHTLIFFDGSGIRATSPRSPQALAVRDNGDSGELLWNYSLSRLPQMSPALDPRGGIWYFALMTSELLRLEESTGQLIQTVDVNSIIDDDAGTFIPYSVMTISGEDESPVMMVAATLSNFSKTYVAAIDLANNSLLWKFQVDEGRGFSGMPSGQYSILSDVNNDPVVVFSTRQNGVWALHGDPGL
jgi:outer membrane protein assembly factor BamB